MMPAKKLKGKGNQPLHNLEHLVQVLDDRWGLSIHDYPPHFAETLRKKAKYDCCKQVDTHECRVYKTPSCGSHMPWDFFIAVCRCGRHHFRLMAEPGRITSAEAIKFVERVREMFPDPPEEEAA